MLRKGKIFEKLEKFFSKRAERASIGTMCSELISRNYKNNNESKKYFLPFNQLAAPFFGGKESIISIKNEIQFVFNLFVDTIKKQKKSNLSVCLYFRIFLYFNLF